jgi:hypothetical protein
MKFKQYMTESEQDLVSLVEYMVFMQEFNTMDEGIGDALKNMKGKVTKVLKKAGIHIQQGEGLIQQLTKAHKGVGQLIYYSFIAYYNNDQKAREKVKEIMISLKPEHILDFILRLDVLTMHLLTGPIHMLDALTGTHIWANVKGKVEALEVRAKTAIESLESLKIHVEGKIQTQIQKYSNALRRVFSIEGYSKTGR